MAYKKCENLPSVLYKTCKVVSLLISIVVKLRDFLVINIVNKNYFHVPRTAKNRDLGDTEFCSI